MFLFCEFTEAVSISPSARFDEHCVTSAFAVVCVFYKRGSRGVWIGSFALRLQDVSAVEVLNLPQKYHPSLWLLLYVASEKFKCSHCTSVEDVCVAGLHFFPIKSIDLCGCINYLVNCQYISGFNTHITGIPPPPLPPGVLLLLSMLLLLSYQWQIIPAVQFKPSAIVILLYEWLHTTQEQVMSRFSVEAQSPDILFQQSTATLCISSYLLSSFGSATQAHP